MWREAEPRSVCRGEKRLISICRNAWEREETVLVFVAETVRVAWPCSRICRASWKVRV